MKIVILTQDDPFYLAQQLDYLLSKMPDGATVVGTVLFEVSPFGAKDTFIQKALKTYRTFGSAFFLRYALKYVNNKFFKSFGLEEVLKKYRIPIINIDGSINSEASLEKIKNYNPDLLISIAGNQIFKESIIKLAPEGCLNLHTSLLPKYRGLMPSFWVLKNNEKFTGVSVFFVNEGIDTGPILVQKKVEIGDRSQEELIKYTKKLGMDAIIEAIKKIQSGTYSLLPNPDSESTYFSFPTRLDVEEFKKNGKKFY